MSERIIMRTGEALVAGGPPVPRLNLKLSSANWMGQWVLRLLH